MRHRSLNQFILLPRSETKPDRALTQSMVLLLVIILSPYRAKIKRVNTFRLV